MYIVIEGPEGTGKTTQANLLAERMRQEGFAVRVVSGADHDNGPLSHDVILHDGSSPGSNTAEALLYSAARTPTPDTIRQVNDAGAICVCDGNYITALIDTYYGRGQKPDNATVDHIISEATEGVRPDLCIILDAPLQTLLERLEKRLTLDKLEKLDLVALERVRAGYLWEANRHGWSVVFATGSETAVSDRIWEQVQPLLAIAPQEAAEMLAPIQSVTIPYIYATPPGLSDELQHTYRSTMNEIGETYVVIRQKLAAHLASQPDNTYDPTYTADSVQPVAVLPDVAMLVSPQAPASVTELARLQMEHTNIIEAEPVTLVEALPRNELGLVPRMIYSVSDQPLHALSDAVESWPYSHKVSLLRHYLNDANQDQQALIFSEVRYVWDIISDVQAMYAFRASHPLQMQWQTLTPRMGFETPELIDEAGLAESYERCFALSLHLFSTLQTAHPSMAAYAVLGGHLTRWSMSLTLQELLTLSHQARLDNVPKMYIQLLDKLIEQVKQTHPVLGSVLNTVSEQPQSVSPPSSQVATPVK